MRDIAILAGVLALVIGLAVVWAVVQDLRARRRKEILRSRRIADAVARGVSPHSAVLAGRGPRTRGPGTLS